jgi:flagellin
MLATADSAMQEIYTHLQNIRDLGVQGANGTTSTAQYSALQADLKAELSAIGGITADTKYGANVLLDGSMSGTAFNIQIGAEAGDTLDIQGAFTDSTYATLGIPGATTLASTGDGSALIALADTALSTLSQNLATVGQYENRLNDHLDYLSNIQSNTESARSSIRDTDVAQETANVSRLNILQQAGAYALAQSNTSAQLALTLLQRM